MHMGSNLIKQYGLTKLKTESVLREGISGRRLATSGRPLCAFCRSSDTISLLAGLFAAGIIMDVSREDMVDPH